MGQLRIDFAGREPPRTILLISHGLHRASEHSLRVRGTVASHDLVPGEYVVTWDDETAGDFLKLRARVPPAGVARLRASDGVPDDEAPFPWKGGKLSVLVRDMRGRPLPGVRVMVRGWDVRGGTTGFGDDTDERGLLEATVRAFHPSVQPVDESTKKGYELDTKEKLHALKNGETPVSFPVDMRPEGIYKIGKPKREEST